ncbi:tripartite tricarboxylate transporter TctB family protein [Rhodococcoides kyotonense]|uniref:Tripartite tricarboxylate transporter TctB family protein n=1 Tax=Rhodococcoides kyotonense TaxID=398843 RepID=A0A239N113_9NOCA|nr:tripartite tricarboxylate transporter TctB family protein [Rhodococcus kyotonensis]SNT48661.1 Tripartite tricarboxylate transporter TctB family protein [Rhodococcus kyotonensis]
MTTDLSDAGTSQRHRRDVWGSAGTIVLSALALERSVTYGLEGSNQPVGPGLFPAVISAAMLVLGLLWALQTWRRSVPEPEEPIEWPDRSGYRRILITVATLAVPAFLMEYIDFRITIFAITFVILKFVFAQSLRLSVIAGIVIAAVCYFGLAIGLGMVLPLSF